MNTLNYTESIKPKLIKAIFHYFVYSVLIIALACSSGSKQATEEVDNKSEQSGSLTSNVKSKKKIVFFGNSLTAGYGLEEDEAFTVYIQKRIDSMGMPFTVVNAGLSGETTAGGLRRIDWVLNQQMDVFFLELGGNDMLRGTEVTATESNLRGIIEKVRSKDPDIPIILAGMQAPPNLGEEYTSAFAKIYPDLANEYDLTLIPFFLEGVAGNPELNLPDGIHPNVEGQKIVAETVWNALGPILTMDNG